MRSRENGSATARRGQILFRPLATTKKFSECLSAPWAGRYASVTAWILDLLFLRLFTEFREQFQAILPREKVYPHQRLRPPAI
jgi:hypothetical protein